MPRSTLYFENCLATISAHPADYVHLIYHPGQHTLTDLQIVLHHTGDLLLRRRWHRLLEDQQQLAQLPGESQQVATAYWQRQTPSLAQSLCVATVLAQDVFARLAAATLRHKLRSTDINYRLFSDSAAANAWLQQQEGCPRIGR